MNYKETQVKALLEHLGCNYNDFNTINIGPFTNCLYFSKFGKHLLWHKVQKNLMLFPLRSRENLRFINMFSHPEATCLKIIQTENMEIFDSDSYETVKSDINIVQVARMADDSNDNRFRMVFGEIQKKLADEFFGTPTIDFEMALAREFNIGCREFSKGLAFDGLTDFQYLDEEDDLVALADAYLGEMRRLTEVFRPLYGKYLKEIKKIDKEMVLNGKCTARDLCKKARALGDKCAKEAEILAEGA